MEERVRTFSIKLEERLKDLSEEAKQWLQSAEREELYERLSDYKKIIELGEVNNWIVICSKTDLSIYGKKQEEIDNYFVNYIEQELFEKIKNRLISSKLLKEKNNLILQIFSAIDAKCYAIAGIALATTIEFLLALNVGYENYKIGNMVKTFQNNTDKLSVDEEGILPSFGLDGFLSNFSLGTQGFDREKEPPFVNRHWVAHGRMYRDLERSDVYQMLCAIYAIDVVIEISDQYKI